MRIVLACVVLMLVGLAATDCLAQEWSLGVAGGFGFTRNLTVTNSTGSGKAGFKPGLAVGAYAGNDMYERWGGELRYLYRVSNLKVSGGGQEAGFSGETHVVHYDFLYHTADRDAKVRPFLAAGGGVKVFRGTGIERAFQPASKFALLTRDQEVLGMVSVGGGVKVALSDMMHLRVDFRDYISPFPTQIVAPAPGAKLKGWLHDFVPMVGVGFQF